MFNRNKLHPNVLIHIELNFKLLDSGGVNFPVIICYTTKTKTFRQLLPTTMKRNDRKLIAKISLKIMTMQPKSLSGEFSHQGEYLCKLRIHLSVLCLM